MTDDSKQPELTMEQWRDEVVRLIYEYTREAIHDDVADLPDIPAALLAHLSAVPPTAAEDSDDAGPKHSCKNCAHRNKSLCDEPCTGCTVRWRSGVSDRWEPTLQP